MLTRRGLLWFLLLALAPAAACAAPKVLVLGDSLSAAYGIELQDGWVAMLQQRIRNEALPHEVVNASISGETTAGGLARLPELLQRHEPALVLIQLGGNDGLRGQPVARLADNLARLVELSAAAGAQAVLFEMMIPPNYGPAYTERFTRSFNEVGERLEVPVVPFFLMAIAQDAGRFQADGIHPTAEAQPELLDAVWPYVEPLLQ